MSDSTPRDPCRFIARCPMFSAFQSQATLRIFKLHYCQSDHRSCERFKRASAGVMPPADLLPDGSRLRPKKPSPEADGD